MLNLKILWSSQCIVVFYRSRAMAVILDRSVIEKSI